MLEDENVDTHEYPVEFQVTLMIKKVVGRQVIAEVWGNRTEGKLSRWEVDVMDERECYGTLTIPETALDCLVHHVCFDDVTVASLGNASSNLSQIFRKIRARFRKE